ncbi:MAG: redoxin domain-containing protein [Agathobacter sp.]|nr:redoxin domain-containing protein [Agathobacter sp.]
MEKLKNLGITIAENFNVIVERAKTDKKFLAALIVGAVAVVALIVALVVGISGSGAQGGGGNTGIGSGKKTTYTVSVKTKGGMILSDIDVRVYNDEKLTDLADAAELEEDGTVELELPESDNYYIEIDGAPKGYEVKDYYQFDGKKAKIVLTSSLITDDDISTAQLGLGDVMYDFTITTPDGEKVQLSELLKEKKMVMLNFWYTNCSWCVKEFPVMAEAYNDYKDDIEILALDPMNEGADAVKAFQTNNNLPFIMAECPTSWSNVFSIQGYPTSVLIDQYGVICCVESGAITSLRPFYSAFEHFTAKDYEQKLCVNGIADLVTQIKPTYEMPKSEDIEAAINGTEGITYRAEEGDAAEFTWPFVLGEKNGANCIYASNKGIEDSYAIIYADIELKKGQAIAFDYIVSCERANDALVVIVNDEDIYQISGADENPTWKTCYPWVAVEDGTYELALCFLKDESTNEGDDTAYIKNLRVVDANAIDKNATVHIPRYAAVEQEDGSYTYADIVYNPADGYYHVGTANGPLLLADLLNYTQFNEEGTVYELVYDDGKFEVDGVDRFADLEQYANYASNSQLTGSCPVTKELGELLMAFAEKYGFEDDENEWLKICKYYDAYGAGIQLEDPIKGLATFSAYTAHMGSGNSFYYDRAILPRGLMAKFVPTTSGVYRITSHNESQQGVDAWIFNENREELLVYERDERMFTEEGEVSMVFYMEVGKAYYIDIAFWDVYEVGTITYDIEYVAPTYNLFRLASPGYFTYDSDATGDAMYYVIAGGIDVVLGDDGIYYEDLGNGKKGSKLYCDFTGITGVFSNPIMTNQGVKGMIDMGGFDFSKTENDMYVLSIIEAQGSVDAADKYLKDLWGEDYDAYAEEYQLKDVYAGKYHGTGKDYTETVRAYCSKIETGSVERNGCVVVTEELAEVLQMIMDKYTFENVDHAWTKLCYYYDYLGPAN